MHLDRKFVRSLLFSSRGFRRFTQDSPVLPNVWQTFGEHPGKTQDLLLTPHLRSSAAKVGSLLRDSLNTAKLDYKPRVVWNDFHVAVSLRFDDLLRFVLPSTCWWSRDVWEHRGSLMRIINDRSQRTQLAQALDDFHNEGKLPQHLEIAPTLLWMANLVGSVRHVEAKAAATKSTSSRASKKTLEPSFKNIAKALEAPARVWAADEGNAMGPAASGKGHSFDKGVPDELSIWRIDLNRKVNTAVASSVRAVKGDAARQLFDVDTSNIHWVIIDSGIDAKHPAFFDTSKLRAKGLDPGKLPEDPSEIPWQQFTRVERTYDFTRIRRLLDFDMLVDTENAPPVLKAALEKSERLRNEIEDLKLHLQKGRQIDWGLLEPFLRVPHDETYKSPREGHGTHVAGILGARGYQEGSRSRASGMCPEIRLWDVRVVGGDGDSFGGGGDDEFSVISALQFITWLNAHKDYLAVHGANLSLSIRQQVESFACGSTPVCEESNRLMASGVMVVAAAGNYGYQTFLTEKGEVEGFMNLSITDPGNAERVLTVGATHRSSPHTYGVSYFSSRGPTGDGRLKPDMVAPGEKIEAPVLAGRWEIKDGTSMAAPHVSGAAALLMARHLELMGKADTIKKILCDTATDLGRERYFQGHGLVDALRALQSV